MIRMALVIVAGLELAAAPVASAQTAPPESDNSWYTFNRIDAGYLRLDGRTDHNPGDELGREPKAPRDGRGIRGSTLIRTALGTTIGVDVAQLLAQTLEPSGKHGLVVQRLFAITLFACVVGHAFDTRVSFGKITTISAPKVGRTILIGFIRVKNCTCAATH